MLIVGSIMFLGLFIGIMLDVEDIKMIKIQVLFFVKRSRYEKIIILSGKFIREEVVTYSGSLVSGYIFKFEVRGGRCRGRRKGRFYNGGDFFFKRLVNNLIYGLCRSK